MMRALLIALHRLANAMDTAELRARRLDGSASSAWVAQVGRQINARHNRINELRTPVARLKESL